jgi:hypothetical protein
MRIIDKTPFQNDKGVVDLIGRVQGTLKYGPSWYSELEAQKAVIAQLDRLLEKGYVLIRNFILPGSEVIIPMILLGPNGIFVIYVTHLKGFYEAKGDQWNKVDQGRVLPAPRNLLIIADRLTRATQKYFELQHIATQVKVEPVLMAAEPGLNIDSMRPIIRVVKSDAINQFAATLMQGRPAMRNEQVYALSERILNPQSPEEAAADSALAAVTGSPQQSSRAKAIFDAAEKPAPANSELDFALEDGVQPASSELPTGFDETDVLPSPKKRLIFGMAVWQIAVLGGITALWLCVMLAFGAYIVYISNLPIP